MIQIPIQDGFSSTLRSDPDFSYTGLRKGKKRLHVGFVCTHDRMWMDKDGNIGCDCAAAGQGLTEADIEHMFDMRKDFYGW
jgi:hypothetical protein